MVVCARFGSREISLAEAFSAWRSGQVNIDYQILVRARMPRILLAGLVGAALACSGVVLQAVLRNPLADPYILGVSSGAGLGVMIASIFGLTWTATGISIMSLPAFAGAIGTVWLVWVVGYFTSRGRMTNLLLAGVVVNAFFSAIIMFLTSTATAHQLRTTVYWLMGTIAPQSYATLAVTAGFIFAGIAVLVVYASRLNVLTFGDAEAADMGIDAGRVRAVILAVAALITAVAVSISGLIGFVGLIIPHGMRLIVGPDHRRLLPLSAIAGATLLIIADTIARSSFGAEELPVGVITAIAGGPFFLVLLARYSRKVGWA